MFLYHKVPDELLGDTLYPLNHFKARSPGLYVREAQKYQGRERVMEQVLPTLGCFWNDVLHFTAVHPLDIRGALREVGFTRFRQDRFYRVDPTLLEPEQTTVYLCRHTHDAEKMDLANFRRYDPRALEHYGVIPPATIAYYEEVFKMGKRPLLYNRIPHILYKGSLRVSNIPILTI